MNTPTLEQLLEPLLEQLARRILELQAEQPAAASEHSSPWMSIDTAAAYLDWPKQRLYKLTAQGAIPHYKHDGRLLFHRRELDEWLADHAQPGDWIKPANRAICEESGLRRTPDRLAGPQATKPTHK